MAKIIPFHGYRPSPDIASTVSSPPYDVITSDEARDIVTGNHYSFLRVIKPEIDFASDNEPKGDILHKHGSKNLREFINNRKLIRDFLYKPVDT